MLVLNLDRLIQLKEEYAEAIEYLREALALVPGHPRTSKTLARIYYRVQGRYDEALSIYRDAIRRHGYVLAEVERTPNLKDLRSDPLFQQMIYAEQAADTR